MTVGPLRRILLATICMLMLFATVTVAKETVFRELSWGDPPETLGESIDITGDGDRAIGLETRLKVDEDYQLGPITVDAIGYTFFAGELLMIRIVASDARMLSEIARAKYGKPFDDNRFIINEAYQHEDTLCSVKESPVTETGTMTLLSTDGLRRYEQWKKERAKAASEAF